MIHHGPRLFTPVNRRGPELAVTVPTPHSRQRKPSRSTRWAARAHCRGGPRARVEEQVWLHEVGALFLVVVVDVVVERGRRRMRERAEFDAEDVGEYLRPAGNFEDSAVVAKEELER